MWFAFQVHDSAQSTTLRVFMCVLHLLPNISSKGKYPEEFGTLLIANSNRSIYLCHGLGCSTIIFKIFFTVEWLLSITLFLCG